MHTHANPKQRAQSPPDSVQEYAWEQAHCVVWVATAAPVNTNTHTHTHIQTYTHAHTCTQDARGITCVLAVWRRFWPASIAFSSCFALVTCV